MLELLKQIGAAPKKARAERGGVDQDPSVWPTRKSEFLAELRRSFRISVAGRPHFAIEAWRRLGVSTVF